VQFAEPITNQHAMNTGATCASLRSVVRLYFVCKPRNGETSEVLTAASMDSFRDVADVSEVLAASVLRR
jgi:hypothetical protein